MARVEAKVELLAHTPEPLALIYAAFRQCYHAGFVGDLWPELTADGADRARQAAFVRSVLESGHGSPVEHVSFTFALSGVSRALTHQLVRHRIASYSQQSQRYVDASNFDYVLPPAVAADPRARERFERFMDEVGAAYRDIKALLEENGRGATAKEDARFVLPQAAATNIVVTMNCRTLLNFSNIAAAPGPSGKSAGWPRPCSSCAGACCRNCSIRPGPVANAWGTAPRARASPADVIPCLKRRRRERSRPKRSPAGHGRSRAARCIRIGAALFRARPSSLFPACDGLFLFFADSHPDRQGRPRRGIAISLSFL